MINIAIIDDNIDFSLNFANDISRILTQKYKLDIFENRESFLNKQKSGSEYHIVFIDILLVEDNGIRAAKEIQLYSPYTSIIFISVERSFFMDVYDVTHTYFLTKPIDEKHLQRALEKCLSNIENSTLSITYRNKTNIFHADKIVFIEGFGKRSLIHYADGTEQEVFFPLREFDKPLETHSTFVRTHQSYIANLKYMVNYHRKKSIFFDYDNKKSVTISRRYADSVDIAVTRFLGDL